MAEYWIYLIPVAAIGYLLWSRRSASTADVKALLERGAQIVDVRAKAEFRMEAHPKAINIPLDQLEQRAGELDPARPVLLCCASGSRSGFGVAVLKRKGFKEVHNLGSWRRIQSFLA
ncbi:rhodanese-like domain-containing protein [Geothrix oryzisoli]|uniref:rhodanese-like domain-containing protein n=1 Tax=Geothrix oryzisoli TaxID=2922721 RepID=UPI001FAE100A|nr:rhodanese-like domain-containing protein [Geothrix oryzisoli]